VSDDSRYSITRRPAPRVKADSVEPPRPAAVVPTTTTVAPRASTAPTTVEDIELPPAFAAGSRTSLRPPELTAVRALNVAVEFGDVELIVEHRGDDVSIVIPGALRMSAPRAQAMALIAALMKRP